MEQRELETKKDKGFTLIELLIVIVILGILATVVVFSVRGITNDAQDNACASDARALETAIEAYYAKFGNDIDPDMDDLTGADLLREASDNYTVTAGELTGVGECA